MYAKELVHVLWSCWCTRVEYVTGLKLEAGVVWNGSLDWKTLGGKKKKTF